MRMIMYVSFPVETFNEAVRDGSAGAKIKRILDHLKPEATYFMARNGQRTAMVVLDLADVSKIPSLAEPWFLSFNASIELHPVMVPQDLMDADLEGLGKAWA
ncbi:MAG: hypothetical protein JWP98_144 [Edaphobacter sp.]|nr:hypothetical protein [Edaphobacter sp.]